MAAKTRGGQPDNGIERALDGAAATYAEKTLTVRIILVTADGLQLAAFHSINILQNVGWHFMGHPVRTTLGAVMAISTPGEILPEMTSAGTGPDIHDLRKPNPGRPRSPVSHETVAASKFL